MFKAYSVSFLNALLFFSLSIQAADSPRGLDIKPKQQDPSEINSHDPFGLHEKAAARHKESLRPKRIFSDEEFSAMIAPYATDLPSFYESKNMLDRVIKKHPAIGKTIMRIKNPHQFKKVIYPSRLLFVGPSGCGKTRAAKAMAKYCGSHCIFIKGSQIGNTYQNSGSTFITHLFEALLERPETSFMVIIDELMTVAKYFDNDKELQQNKMAIALWQALDNCENKRNVCVIGTDNADPEKLTDALKTRFAHKIFVFESMDQNDIVGVMKECLGYAPNVDITQCSDAFLQKLARSVQKLSIREIKDLIEESKVAAIIETQNPDACVTEKHLTQVFSMYKDPTVIEKAWKERNKHWSNITSARAIAAGMFVAGTGIKLYDSYRRNGFTLSTGAVLLLGSASVITYCCSKQDKEEDTNDLQFFSAVNHLTDQHESHAQWETSHAFNFQSGEEAKDARKDDIGRANKHLEYAKNADERGKEQMDQSREAQDRAKWDQIVRLKESIKQAEVELDKSAHYHTDAKKALSDHIAYLKEELYRLKPDERPQEPVKEKGLLSFFWG